MRFWITMVVLFAAFVASGIFGKNCGDGLERELMVMSEAVLFWTISICLVRRAVLKMKVLFSRTGLRTAGILTLGDALQEVKTSGWKLINHPY